MSWRRILAASLSITGLNAGYGAVRSPVIAGHDDVLKPALENEELHRAGGDVLLRHDDIDHRDFRWERFEAGEPLVSPHPYVGAGQMR